MLKPEKNFSPHYFIPLIWVSSTGFILKYHLIWFCIHYLCLQFHFFPVLISTIICLDSGGEVILHLSYNSTEKKLQHKKHFCLFIENCNSALLNFALSWFWCETPLKKLLISFFGWKKKLFHGFFFRADFNTVSDLAFSWDSAGEQKPL